MVKIEMKKFGKVLNSRPAAKEAALRVKQIINGIEGDITLDFNGVDILTPSFADEFVKGLKSIYPNKNIDFQSIEQNEIIKETLKAVNAI